MKTRFLTVLSILLVVAFMISRVFVTRPRPYRGPGSRANPGTCTARAASHGKDAGYDQGAR